MIFLWAFVFLLAIAVLCLHLYSNQIIGKIGENHTAKRIKAVCGEHVFQDVYVPGSRGVQQIDILAVTEKGVLVIEKKTYIGLVVGRNFDKQWKVYVNRGRKNYTMKNPHHQNFGHIQALCENFPALQGKCVDLVIFGNNAKLGNGISKGTIRDAEFENFYASLPLRLSENEVSQFGNMISGLSTKRAALKKKHCRKIKQMKSRFAK